MAAEMEFFLLGPLEVRCAGQIVPVRHGKERAVFAALLLHAGQAVPVDELAEALWWPGDPPPSAHVTVRNYVKRLRQALGDLGRDRISTQRCAYMIRVDDGELDISQFEALLVSARMAARDGAWATVADQARAALSLWRRLPAVAVTSAAMSASSVGTSAFGVGRGSSGCSTSPG